MLNVKYGVQAESAQVRGPAQPAGPSEFSVPGGGLGMAASPGDLTQCEGCGRSFNPKAFEVHSRICAKVFQVITTPNPRP